MSKACWTCGRFGHYAAWCQRCELCGTFGHKEEGCFKKRVQALVAKLAELRDEFEGEKLAMQARLRDCVREAKRPREETVLEESDASLGRRMRAALGAL